MNGKYSNQIRKNHKPLKVKKDDVDLVQISLSSTGTV